MKTILSFKVKMAASEYTSVPSFPAMLWSCRTLSCCHSALLKTPRRLRSCSKMSGTSDRFRLMQEKQLLPVALTLRSITSHVSACSRPRSILQTYFEWECSGPFQLKPDQGLLKPSQECPITVVFQPPEALVYQEHAYCWFGEGQDRLESGCTVLLQGLGTVTSNR